MDDSGGGGGGGGAKGDGWPSLLCIHPDGISVAVLYTYLLLVRECKAFWGEHSSVRNLQHEDGSDEGLSNKTGHRQLYHFVWEI